MKPKTFLIAQNVNIYSGDGKNQFARTGELGFHHFKKVGVSGVILGHSEVKDNPEVVNKKWKSAIENSLFNNIVLIGEDWDDLEKGWDMSSEQEKKEMKDKLKNKLSIILDGISEEIIGKTVFGYEPSWGTRGSGKEDVLPPQPAQIENMCLFIREIIKDRYNKNIRIIYGGSSSPERTEEIMPLNNVDGLILGSAGKTVDWVFKIGKEIVRNMEDKESLRKGILALNWKAYELEEPYINFLKIIKNFDGSLIDIYLSPVATELKEVNDLL
ncbi:MAG: triose-phosphate isomerase [Candidatus Paceibacterota bacterium]|jgi:triosephosphate isomerase